MRMTLRARALWEPSDLTGGPPLGSRASTCVDYGQLLLTSLFPKSVVDVIRMPVHSVLALYDPPVVQMGAGAPEAKLETDNKHKKAQKSQGASKDVEIVANGAQPSSLEGHLWTEEEWASQMLVTTYQHGPKLHAARAVRSSPQLALRSNESHSQVVCASE